MVANHPASSPSTKTLRLTARLHYGQKEMQVATEPVVAAIAGSGGGKTVILKLLQMIDMIKHPNEVWLFAEPTWPMVTRILLTSYPKNPSLPALVKHFDPKSFYSKTDHIIYSTLGTIFLASASHPQSMEGAHVAGASLDEAGLMSALALETAKRRVASKGGRVRIGTTPYNRGFLYRQVYLPAREGDPDIKVINFPSTANPAYSREAFERARRTMTEARFNMMHLGGFERPEGMILSNWNDSLLIDPFPIPDTWWQGAALDFGWNHPFAGIWGARDDDGTYYLTHEYKKGQTLLADHYKAITKISTNGANPQIWYADPSARQERAELRRLGLPLRAANNDVLTGLDTLNELMATGRLRVFRTMTNWLDEVEGYVWDTKDDNFTDKPIKLNDDLIDCTRYLIHTAEKTLAPQLFT